MLKTLQIRKGQKLTIRAVAFPSEQSGNRDKCPTLSFFQEQSQEHQEDFQALLALLDYTSENGPHPSDTKFKYLSDTDGLYEFKTSGGLRLFCFWDEGNLIICTHGMVKKKQKTPKEQINQAERTKKLYEAAKTAGTLTHVEPRLTS